MKVLIIGSGSQEHALAWKLSQSRLVTRIYCCPGNPGVAQIAECIDIQPNDLNALVDFVKYEWIDLTVITDTSLLLQGMVDLFGREGCRVIGPNLTASRLGASRAVAKNLVRLTGVPSPEFSVFSSFLHAQDHVRLKGAPIVIKLEETFIKHGIFRVATVEEAVHVLRLIMKERIFGNAGKHVIVEAPLSGEILTCVALSDGRDIIPFSSLRKYGHIIEGKRGLKQTGLGACSRVLQEPRETERIFAEKIIRGIRKAFLSEGISFKGVLSADLLVQKDRVYLCDMATCSGGPEMQTLLPCLKTDFTEVALAIAGEKISDLRIEWHPVSSVCVEVFSGDNGGATHRGMKISGLEGIRSTEGVSLFHNSTALKNDDVVTSGEHVLSVSAVGKDIREARAKAYDALKGIHFQGIRYLKDVGADAD
jgi:phosphoribosylamine--glycine ligase